jgi:hypothetical protein
MAKRIANYQASEYIARLEEFQGNNFRAVRWSNGDYEIYSYAALIGGVKDGTPWVTDRKYSVTTSRHTNYVRKGLASVVAKTYSAPLIGL